MTQLSPWANERMTERTRKSPVNNGIVGSLLLLPLFALIMYGLIMGIPYVYHRVTLPWAGAASSSDSLLGVWVGKLGGSQSADYESFLKAGGHGVPPRTAAAPTAVMLTIGLEFQWGVPKVKGTAVSCGRGGARQTSTFHLAWIRDPANFSLTLTPTSDRSAYTALTGHFTPGTLQVEWPQIHGNSQEAGTLHKGDAGQFDALCGTLH